MKRFLAFITTSSFEGIDPKDALVGDFDTSAELWAVEADWEGTSGQRALARSTDLNILDTATGQWTYTDVHRYYGSEATRRNQETIEKLFATPLPKPTTAMRRYQLHHTVAHESLYGMSGLVGTWDTIPEVIAFLNVLDLTQEATYAGRKIDLTAAFELTLVDTATTRCHTVDYADEAVHPTGYSREYLDFAQFDQLSKPIFGEPDDCDAA